MSTLGHGLKGVLSIGALVLSVLVGIARAASTNATTEAYRATEAISYVLGSKRAIGYFQTVDGQCEVTLMIADAADPDRALPGSAARLHFAMHPGQGAALASEQGPEMVLVCGAGAATVEVTQDATRP
jgi:hypothetical protein